MSKSEVVRSGYWYRGASVIAQSRGLVTHEFCGTSLVSDPFDRPVVFSHFIKGALPEAPVAARLTAGVVQASQVVPLSAV
jgi:hypothetical protein